jgi:sugar phosphate isomerase/epimerase
MELGIGSYTYGWAVEAGGGFDELSLVAAAGTLGVSLIQVGDNLPLHTFTEGRLKRFRDMLDQRGLKIEAGARGLTVQRLGQYIAICRELGAGLLRFVVDDQEYRPSVGEIIQIIQSQLGLLEQHDIILAIENHDRLSSAALAGIIGAVGSPHAGICLDTVNSMGAGEGIREVIDRLGPDTVNLHIKDFGIRRLEHKQGFIIDGRVAGEGMLDIPFLLHRINSYQRCRTCILEQWVPRGGDSAGTIAKEHLWAEQGIAYLKHIGT